MNKKRLIITSIISILLVSILMIGSTYSIFTSSDVDEDTNVYTTGDLNVTYTSSEDSIKLTDSTPMSYEQAIMVMPYRITVTNNGNVPYKFDVILNDTTAGEVINYQYIMTQVGKLTPKPLNECENEVIKEDVIVAANSTVDIDVRIWISNKVPSTEIGKSFYAKLSIDGLAIYDDRSNIDNYVLTALKPFSGYIQSLYNDGSEINTVNIAGDASKPQVHLNATQGIMLDNNGDYRYYGANPNNYVEYNDELWRIISVGNVKANENDTVGETRVKIVKADILTAKETGTNNNITAFSYDNSANNINSGNGVNDWSKADLMTELNTIYYNSTSGTCYIDYNNASKSCDFTNTGLNQEARNLTADALYYLGGSFNSSGLYTNDYYNFERGITVWGTTNGQTCNDGACPRATTWTGKVGIIYPSDYTYASDLNVCKKDGQYYNDANCKNNNWLLYPSNYQWTISPVSSNAFNAFVIDYVGTTNALSTYFDSVVRPVQYLKANVIITGGNGTEEKPYTIAANPTNAAEYVQSLYNDGSEINTVNIAGDTSKPEVHLNATQGIMLDNNGDYRYYGANPNNYVEYNDELWRIISVGNVKANENDTVGETRVKIVKADILTAKETGTNNDITGFSYDSSYFYINDNQINIYGAYDWSKADLMTELNTLYYNGTSGVCYINHADASKLCDFTNTGLNKKARNLTADALYYLGGSLESTDFYANDYYNFERGTTVWGSSGEICNDGACPRATTWTGRVGIMYPSDYTYATDLNLCKKDGNSYYTDTNCTNNTWLLDTTSNQWTISPHLHSSYSAFYVSNSGSVYYYYYRDNNALGVRPVQYLKSNVAIVGGEGTSEKPYLLELW